MCENIACARESQGKSSIVYIAVGYPKANGTVSLQQTLGAGSFSHTYKSRENQESHSIQVPDLPHEFILPHTQPSAEQEGMNQGHECWQSLNSTDTSDSLEVWTNESHKCFLDLKLSYQGSKYYIHIGEPQTVQEKKNPKTFMKLPKRVFNYLS